MKRMTKNMYFLSNLIRVNTYESCYSHVAHALVDMFTRYITPSPGMENWGISIHSLGWQDIQPGDPYPAGKHPEQHLFHWKQGRVLDELQLVYIPLGSGEFWSEETGTLPIHDGTVLVLFNGVRHRYRPNKATGWKEYWIGFSGSTIEPLMHQVFSPASPVIEVGPSPDILRLFQDCCDLAEQEVHAYRKIISGKIIEAVARIQSKPHNVHRPQHRHEEAIRLACVRLNESIETGFSSEGLAKEVGMSHTSFRRHFKQSTGMSPMQYLLELRLRKAQSLIANTRLPVQTIAAECGFENPLYFSRFFKQRTGLSPSASRQE